MNNLLISILSLQFIYSLDFMDAVYREGGLLNNQDHAGIYDGNEVYEIKGYWNYIEKSSWESFLDDRDYLGSFTTDDMSNYNKNEISYILEVLDNEPEITYTMLNSLVYNESDESHYYIQPNEITDIRCEGVIEYAYEFNWIDVWGISNTGNQYGSPHHHDITDPEYLEEHNNFIPDLNPEPWEDLTPKVQRGGYGTEWTKLKSTAGDINHDGLLNISDILIIVELIFSNAPFEIGGDANLDGIINIGDIVALIQIILNVTFEINYANHDEIIFSLDTDIINSEITLNIDTQHPIRVLKGDVYLSSNIVPVRIEKEILSENLELNFIISRDSTKVSFIIFGIENEINQGSSGKILKINYENKERNNNLDSLTFSLSNFELANNPKFLLKYSVEDTSITMSKNKSEKTYFPFKFNLKKAYPNPFNPTTTINYEIAHETNVNLTIINLIGQTIENLVSEIKQPGHHTTQWNANDVSSGIYLIQMNTLNYSATQKIILLK